ncbi:hypothetical protein H5410_039887 [Solanum commersonii]|uniref:ATP synthase alpha subunit C-terminal domain-containing protein n=1 Tax=Solanum commersonii TaxID=4109 RepID=A0A9J5XNG3_SOLCO|nr:hypothetical protein H5410_039887 [Solanum commersonii]
MDKSSYPDLFNSNRHAINVGISAFEWGPHQIKAMKQVARSTIRELLKQSQLAPLTVEERIMTIYTETNGYLDSLEKSYLLPRHLPRKRKTLLKEAIQEQMDRFILQEQA